MFGRRLKKLWDQLCLSLPFYVKMVSILSNHSIVLPYFSNLVSSSNVFLCTLRSYVVFHWENSWFTNHTLNVGLHRNVSSSILHFCSGTADDNRCVGSCHLSSDVASHLLCTFWTKLGMHWHKFFFPNTDSHTWTFYIGQYQALSWYLCVEKHIFVCFWSYISC